MNPSLVTLASRNGWLGFDERTFLNEHEYVTYCRRLPVRYAAKNLGRKPEKCEVCGGAPTPDNPLQAAHRIPFGKGILQFRLTPDWLDSRENLVWAHKRLCNRRAEMSIDDIREHLGNLPKDVT